MVAKKKTKSETKLNFDALALANSIIKVSHLSHIETIVLIDRVELKDLDTPLIVSVSGNTICANSKQHEILIKFTTTSVAYQNKLMQDLKAGKFVIVNGSYSFLGNQLFSMDNPVYFPVESEVLDYAARQVFGWGT